MGSPLEITLHLEYVCAAQRQSSAAPVAGFGPSTPGTNLLPRPTSRATMADRGVIARTTRRWTQAARRYSWSNPPKAWDHPPPMLTSPPLSGSRPAINRSTVLLPHPLGPTSTITSA